MSQNHHQEDACAAAAQAMATGMKVAFADLAKRQPIESDLLTVSTQTPASQLPKCPHGRVLADCRQGQSDRRNKLAKCSACGKRFPPM